MFIASFSGPVQLSAACMQQANATWAGRDNEAKVHLSSALSGALRTKLA